jgi:hypothetical protein
MIVTVGHHYGHLPPVLTKDDLAVTERYAPLAVTNLTALRGERGGLELFLLVDHCSNCEPGSKFEELSQFVRSQPPTTKVGIAYIMNGKLQLGIGPTCDHQRAIQALNTPEGSKPASPFRALEALIRSWPQQAPGSDPRRAVLMISNGINPSAADKLQDPTAEAALEAAQRAGVTVWVIYHPSADYPKTDPSQVYSGQVQLAHVADETGGEAYFVGFGPLPSLAPFLADLADHLANQYLLEFMVNPAEGEGSIHSVTVKSKVADIEVMAPNRVFVSPAEGAAGEERPSTLR